MYKLINKTSINHCENALSKHNIYKLTANGRAGRDRDRPNS